MESGQTRTDIDNSGLITINWGLPNHLVWRYLDSVRDSPLSTFLLYFVRAQSGQLY